MGEMLSGNFSLAEMVRSDYARKNNIKNEPDEDQKEALRFLAKNLLQLLRDHFGRVKVNSAFRSKTVNNRIGGSKGSKHLLGEAADVVPVEKGQDILQFACYIFSFLPFDGLVLELKGKRGWVHVSASRYQERTKLQIAYPQKLVTWDPVIHGSAVQWMKDEFRASPISRQWPV